MREGTDATVVAIGKMVSEAEKAAAALSEEGIEVEIIDPRTLLPFDMDTVIQSAKKN